MSGGLLRLGCAMLCALGVAAAAAAASPSPDPLRMGPLFLVAAAADDRPQVAPSVAYDGAGTFLVVWQQGQRYFEQQEGDILAARIDRQGTVLDPQPIVVSRAPESQEAPQVAFSDGVFLVVWQDIRSGAQWDVYGARVTPAGRVLDPGGVAIAAKPDSEALPQVAPAPDGFLVVWQSRSTRYYEVTGAHVSAQGRTTAFELRDGPRPLYGGELSLARVDGGWHLAWNDEVAWGFQNIITRRFGQLVGDPRRPALANVEMAPSVHLGGEGGRLVTAGDRTLYVSAQVGGRGQRVWTAALLDRRAAAQRNPNPEKPYGMSMWDPARMIPVVPPGNAADGVVAGSFACKEFLLVARFLPLDRRSSAYRLMAVRLDADGRRLESSQAAVVLFESQTPVAEPASASTSEGHLVVFVQRDGRGSSRLHARLIQSCG